MIHFTLDPRKWFIKKEKKPNGIVGIACNEQGIALCHGLSAHGDFKIVKLEFANLSPEERFAYVKDWVARNRLSNASCHLVLSQDEYELELIEAPPVEDDELHEAVRWRLKDLISMPIEDAAIDIFLLPEDAYRGRKKMLYVVAVEKELIEKKLNFIRKAGLDPQVIDIEELALRNLSLYMPDTDQGTVAFLSMKENNGQLLMFSHEDMYLTRSIEMGYSSFLPQPTDEWQVQREDQSVMAERFSLDIQRSLDYYESQLGKGIANKLYILPSAMDDTELKRYLQDMLSQNVASLNCIEHVPFDDAIQPSIDQQALCLPAIGAVLRRA